MEEKLLELKNLKKEFIINHGLLKNDRVKAVDNVSFWIGKGVILGLVGESGCGKTTLARTILRIYEPDSGQIIFEGKDVTKKNFDPLRKKMQMVYQDPHSSLNPKMQISDIIGEPLDIHNMCSSKKERYEKIISLLELVGIGRKSASRYPHEFSSGQQQRIGIARALALNPEFLICDEPTASLDFSITAQIINLFKDLQRDLNMTYMFISHNFPIVKYMSDNIAIMNAGEVVEFATSKDLYENPLHPYTKTLVTAFKALQPKKDRSKNIHLPYIDYPDKTIPPSGCKFRYKCPYAKEICKEQKPIFRNISGIHNVSCHRVYEIN